MGCFLIMIHMLFIQILWQTVYDVHYANVDVLVSNFDFCWTENKTPKTDLISKVTIEVDMRKISCCEPIHLCYQIILDNFFNFEFGGTKISFPSYGGNLRSLKIRTVLNSKILRWLKIRSIKYFDFTFSSNLSNLGIFELKKVSQLGIWHVIIISIRY